MAAVEQAKELLEWTKRYEHAKHMLHKIREMLMGYHRQMQQTRNMAEKAKISLLQAKSHMHAAYWTRVRDFAAGKIKFHLGRYHQELAR